MENLDKSKKKKVVSQARQHTMKSGKRKKQCGAGFDFSSLKIGKHIKSKTIDRPPPPPMDCVIV
jgi:hypothetical protein